MKEIYLELDEQFAPIVILLHPSVGAENPHTYGVGGSLLDDDNMTTTSGHFSNMMEEAMEVGILGYSSSLRTILDGKSNPYCCEISIRII
jgi:hypothetical protein